MKVVELKLEKIKQKFNSRTLYRDHEMRDLMASMKKDGLLQAIAVRKDGDDYEVVYGNRRFIAAQKLGWEKIPATVIDDINEIERDFLNLVENMKRSQTSTFDEGKVYDRFLAEGLNASEIGTRLGIAEKRVKDAVEVYRRLPEEYRDKVVGEVDRRRSDGRMSAAQAVQLLNIQREAKLNAEQAKALFKYAHTQKAPTAKIKLVARHLYLGASVTEAVAKMDDTQIVTCHIVVDKNSVKKLESEHGKNIRDLIVDWVDKMPELKVRRSLQKHVRKSARPTTKEATA